MLLSACQKTKRLKCLLRPRNALTSCLSLCSGQFLTTCVFLGSARRPSLETRWPGNWLHHKEGTLFRINIQLVIPKKFRDLTEMSGSVAIASAERHIGNDLAR